LRKKALIQNTVRKEFGFPGGQTLGLPTLVQNQPTTNNIVNLTVWPPGNPPGLFTVRKKKVLKGIDLLELRSM
jgi:hypothetical protein